MNKKEKSRLKIMHEAKWLFEEKGLDNITFNQIADSADVCRTTVFNHFANIKELMLAIYEQEISDIKEYCKNTGLKGVPLIKAMFDKLIEDTAYYPMLTTKLTNNAILSGEAEKPIKAIDSLVRENLQGGENQKTQKNPQLATLILGAYYGLINNYHMNNKPFEAERMKDEFHQLLNILLGGQENE